MPLGSWTVVLARLRSIFLLSCLAACHVAANGQDLTSANDPGLVPGPAPVEPPPIGKSASDGSILSRPDARAITLRIPAPRGLIVARDGEPFAQNAVAYQVALQFKQLENADSDFILNWARTRLDLLGKLVKSPIEKTDQELLDHYRHRRWLPLLVSGQLEETEARSLESKLGGDLILHPVYRRYYPEDSIAAHIIGYTGKGGKMPTGPINFNEPMWEESEGRAGFEKLFDRELTGDAGMKRLLFDEEGNKLLEEQVKRPKPGGTLVTTLNYKWQKLAENVLRKGCKRGAFVVIDVITGEVLVMASRPSFDLNSFIPGISDEDYQALLADKARPLYSRAYQSAYPPASAFKPIVALAALNNGTVTERSTVYSPASIRIGNHTFRNWSATPEGSINVRRALARSCNTWFYQVGIDVGPSTYLGLARRLGMGERSGLPLIDETSGIVPNDEYMMRRHGRNILDGDTANMSIGQGDLLASPLQVAQAMAGIANGGALPKLQLIRQIQDTRGRVTKAMLPERKLWLGVDEVAVEIVRDGMHDVVAKGYGTGRSAGLSYTTLCGKTGTAQWGPKALNQRLAWFAGFLPLENPRYAFAVLYEGSPGQTVSGGRMAAPMVRNFFEPIKDDIKDIIAPPKKALIVVDEDSGALEGDEPVKAVPVDEDEMTDEDEEPSDEVEEPSTEDGEPLRAVPVDEDEIIDDGSEEP